MHDVQGGCGRGERCAQGGGGVRGGRRVTTPRDLDESKAEKLKAPLSGKFSR